MARKEDDSGIGVVSHQQHGIGKLINEINQEYVREYGQVLIDNSTGDIVNFVGGSYPPQEFLNAGVTTEAEGGFAPTDEVIPQKVATGFTDPNITEPRGVFVRGNYAYIASEVTNSIVVVDVTDPLNPTYLTSVAPTGLDGPWDVWVSGNYAYTIGRFSSDIHVIDVSDPTTASAVGSASGSLSNPDEIMVRGNYAYVASWGNSTVCIFDVSNPGSPTEVSTINCYATGIFVGGDYAYAVGGSGVNLDGGVTSIDISDPANPVELDYLASLELEDCNSVFIQNNYAYVTGPTSGYYVIVDVTDPANMSQVGFEDNNLLTTVSDNFVRGNYAYVTSAGGMCVVDVTDKTNPHVINNINPGTSNDFVDIAVRGNYAYLVDSNYDGMWVVG